MKIKENNKFKIIQIFDTHMIIDIGICKNVIDVYKNYLSKSEIDSFTIKFIKKILDVKKSNFVIFIEN